MRILRARVLRLFEESERGEVGEMEWASTSESGRRKRIWKGEKREEKKEEGESAMGEMEWASTSVSEKKNEKGYGKGEKCAFKWKKKCKTWGKRDA